MYFWYFHSMKLLHRHSTSFLIGVRRALPARSQREKGDWHVFTCWSAWLNQNTTWSKTISPLSLKVHLPWWAWSGADDNTDGLNIPCPKPSLEKPVCTHLRYPPPSSLTILRGSTISQQMGHLLGEGRIQAHKDQVSFPKNLRAIAW